jgi:geranylgeranyl diphosphate synthase type II
MITDDDTTEIETYMGVCRDEINTTLKRLLPTQSEAPPAAIEAMRYSLFAGGKRLRPILTLAAASTVGRTASEPLQPLVHPAACAVEMIHTYSLIHDDLPAMDDDTLRRGRPTSHVVYGEGLAILAGDALLTEAFRVLARWPDTRDPSVLHRKLRVAERIASAAGVIGMVGGQVIDLDAAGQLSPSSSVQRESLFGPEKLRAMHERKTGALIRAAAVAGALMIGGSETDVQAIDDYATHLGLGFQIVDDILDVESTADQLGKTVGKDAAAEKPTYPGMFGLEKSRRMALSSIEQAKTSLETVSLGGRLSDIANWVIARTH